MSCLCYEQFSLVAITAILFVSFLQKRDIAKMRKSITTMNKVSWKEHAELLKDLSMKAALDGDSNRLNVLHNIGATFSSEECDIAIKHRHYECVEYIAKRLIESGKYEQYITDICDKAKKELDCLKYHEYKTTLYNIEIYAKSITNNSWNW